MSSKEKHFRNGAQLQKANNHYIIRHDKIISYHIKDVILGVLYKHSECLWKISTTYKYEEKSLIR